MWPTSTEMCRMLHQRCLLLRWILLNKLCRWWTSLAGSPPSTPWPSATSTLLRSSIIHILDNVFGLKYILGFPNCCPEHWTWLLFLLGSGPFSLFHHHHFIGYCLETVSMLGTIVLFGLFAFHSYIPKTLWNQILVRSLSEINTLSRLVRWLRLSLSTWRKSMELRYHWQVKPLWCNALWCWTLLLLFHVELHSVDSI